MVEGGRAPVSAETGSTLPKGVGCANLFAEAEAGVSREASVRRCDLACGYCQTTEPSRVIRANISSTGVNMMLCP